jgi:hypothetical protein
MRAQANRVLALGGLAAGGAALLMAVLSALGTSAPATGADGAAASGLRSGTVAFGTGRVAVRLRAGGACFDVRKARSVAHACVKRLGAGQIRYATTDGAIGGVAGPSVRAVIVRLTQKGTVWASLERSVFYADVPLGHRVRAVVKVLRGGTRRTFAVRATR